MIDGELIEMLIRPIYDAKDHAFQSGSSYWENLTSDFALAAAVLEPEFHDLKPWV